MDPALWGLLLGSFLAATLLPGGSEALLLYLHQQQDHAPLTLLAVATLGNTLGGLSSWLLGRAVAWRYPGERLLQPAQQRALRWLGRHGAPALLLSWLPLVGDPLCVAAGWLRVGWAAALVYIAVGKAARYGALLWLAGAAA